MSTPPTGQPNRHIQQEKAVAALKLFKVAAVVVGIGLLVLVVQMILKHGFHNSALDWWPQPHGMLFILYMAATANLGFKMRWDLGRIVVVVLAGCVPFLSFWMERKVSADTESVLARL